MKVFLSLSNDPVSSLRLVLFHGMGFDSSLSERKKALIVVVAQESLNIVMVYTLNCTLLFISLIRTRQDYEIGKMFGLN